MIDRYTKIVLTVIAAALVGLVVQNTIGPLHAQNDVRRVFICDARNVNQCATLANLGTEYSPRYGLSVLAIPPR